MPLRKDSMWNIDNSPEELEKAKEWLEEHLNLFSPGGVWMIPRSGTAYEINRDTRVAVRLFGTGDEPVERVMKAIGWEVQT